MPDDPQNNFTEWFKKAEEDELSAEALIGAKKGSASTVCFLSQQAVEKLIKGLLIFHRKSFPKVHDLLELESLLVAVEPQIKEYEKELDLLSTYYIETRYPGDYPDFTWDDAEEAFEAAQKIKKFVIEKIKKA